MSILYRTREWLTLAQLLPAWARELADDKTNADHVERELTHFLIEDMINGRLDDAGPLADGRRLGLRIITPDNRAGYLDGQQARELLMPAGTPATFSFVSHRLVVMKQAVLDFARRHELPPPSWWTDASTATKEQTGDLPELTGSFSNDLAAPGQPNHGRRASGPKSIRDLEALPSSTLRWLYNLMPEPTKFEMVLNALPSSTLRWPYSGLVPEPNKFEIYGRERELAKRILAERDRSTATARAPAPPLTTSALEAAVDSSNVVPQPAPITPGPNPAGTGTGMARRRRKGPAPGTVDRYGASDRALFPKIECIMRERHKSVHATALELALTGRVQGNGTPESRAKRLAMRFRKERRPTATR